MGEADDLTRWIRETPRIDGVDAIVLPGDPERRVLEERSGSGIPLDDAHAARLAELAVRLQVCVPASLGGARPADSA